MACRLLVVWLWVKRIALALTAPLWLPVVVFAFATELVFLPGEWRVRRQMRRAGRRMGWCELLARLRARAGTLIVERPLPSWSFSRAWWTPEVVPCPERLAAPDSLCPWATPFDAECHVRFTDLDGGQAKLVAVWWGGFVVAILRCLFPRVAVIRYCSFIPPSPEAEPATTSEPAT
jgi:hypothetical protein